MWEVVEVVLDWCAVQLLIISLLRMQALVLIHIVGMVAKLLVLRYLFQQAFTTIVLTEADCLSLILITVVFE